MRPAHLFVCSLLAWFAGISPALGDGGFFFREGVATDLAQTRQEVLIAVYDDGDGQESVPKVTYVLSSRYAGEPDAFAWVVPAPGTPTDVVAHANRLLFDSLNEDTRPRFIIRNPSRDGYGWGCGCGAQTLPGGGGRDAQLVEVEAQGEAGIFAWAALTSTGSDALLNWLNQNGFTVPPVAGPVLAGYIQQEWHFLAVRVREPDELVANSDGEIEIPPIQFTCRTSQPVYPMTISQVSAADETEVLIYVLADHRAQAENVPNAVIDRDAVVYDPASSSQTNYEALFAQTIADLGGVALITEYAQDTYGVAWVTAPPAALDLPFLTRMRTVLGRDQMDSDFEFRDAATDQPVHSWFWVDASSMADTAAVVGRPSAAVLLYGLVHAVAKRRTRRARGRKPAGPDVTIDRD